MYVFSHVVTLTSCLSRPYSEGCKGNVVALPLSTSTVSSMTTMQMLSLDLLVDAPHPSHGHCHLLHDDDGPRRNQMSCHVIACNVPTKVLPPPYVHASAVPRLRSGSSGYLGHGRVRLCRRRHRHYGPRIRILFVDGRGITPHRHFVDT